MMQSLRGRAIFVGLIALALVSLAGCVELETQYGTRFGHSINGPNALHQMFRASGYDTIVRTRLDQPRQVEADTAVWMPMGLPDEDSRFQVEEWLAAKSGRVMIFVGPGYDGEADYWERVLKDAPKEKRKEIIRLRDEAQDRILAQRQQLPSEEDCNWFRFERREPGEPSTVGAKVFGQWPWTEGLKAEDLQLDFSTRLAIIDDYDEVLLSLGGEPVVSRLTFDADDGGYSSMLLVTDAQFLLNLPLVEHEHAKLAQRLIDEVAVTRKDNLSWTPGSVESNQTVMFLEAERFSAAEPQPGYYDFLVTPPLSYVALQLALLAVVFALSRWAAMGRRHTPVEGSHWDFGRHIEAQAGLLRRLGAESWARERLREYDQRIRERGPRQGLTADSSATLLKST